MNRDRKTPRTAESQMSDVAARIDRQLAGTLRDAAVMVETWNTDTAYHDLARAVTLQRRYHAARAAFHARIDADQIGY